MWLNYHHLYYFYRVVQAGGFSAAATLLRVSQSTVSEQVRILEDQIGQKLFESTRQNLRLSEAGKLAMAYAERIFPVGDEFLSVVKGQAKGEDHRIIRIGAQGNLSKNLQLRFLQPLLVAGAPFAVEAGLVSTLAIQLEQMQLDVVIANQPLRKSMGFEVYNHLLAENPLVLVATPDYRSRLKNFPQGLSQVAMFVPADSEIRADASAYFESRGVSVKIQSEIADVALLRLLALTGKGVSLLPRVGVERELASRELYLVHQFRQLRESFYAITRERRFPHPLVEKMVRGFELERSRVSQG